MIHDPNLFEDVGSVVRLVEEEESRTDVEDDGDSSDDVPRSSGGESEDDDGRKTFPEGSEPSVGLPELAAGGSDAVSLVGDEEGDESSKAWELEERLDLLEIEGRFG